MLRFALPAFALGLLVSAAPALADQDCAGDLQKLAARRTAAMSGINEMVASAKGKKLDPAAFCVRSRPLNAAEEAMLAYMVKNKDWCQIPDEAIARPQGFARQERRLRRQGLHGRRSGREDEEAGRAGAATTAGGRRAAGAAAAGRPALKPDAAVLPDARPASFALKLAPPFAVPYVQLARLDRPIGWQLAARAVLVGDGAGGRRRRITARTSGICSCSSSAPSSCAAPAAPITTSSTATSTPRSSARAIARSPRAASASPRRRFSWSCCRSSGLAVLLQFNAYTIAVGIGSLAVVAIYPLMKRVTSWPQAVLGLAFSWGALVGWTATRGRLEWPALALYAASICWTVGYDTIYAQQDSRDDAIVGIRSTARLFGELRARRHRGVLRARRGADVGGHPRRRRRRPRRNRLARLRRPSHLAGAAHRRSEPGDGAQAVPLQPRRGAAIVRRPRRPGSCGVRHGRPCAAIPRGRRSIDA